MPSVLVTGASRGIGRAIAERFGTEGYDVAVNYRSSTEQAAEAVAAVESSGRRAVAIRADVSDPEAARGMVERASAELDGLDHVVNNAGINQHRSTDELTPGEFDRMLRVNAHGVFTTTKAAVPHLAESDVEEGPSIINLASILAFVGAAHEPHYAASKMAVVGLTRSHADEFAPDVRVNALAPGHILTDMTSGRSEAEERRKRREIPLDEFGSPEDVAQAASYLRDAGFVTGEVLHVNGGETMR
jgi:NAD(P)-dependent dehydrogenase (short-subunit alcohol dehydrogenase family)